MADPRFYTVAGPFDIDFLANIVLAEVRPVQGAAQVFTDISALYDAEMEHVSFIDNRKYVEQFENTRAGAVITPPDLVKKAPKSTVLLICNDPYSAYATIADVFYPDLLERAISGSKEFISETAQLGKNVRIDLGVVIKDGVWIGDNCIIGANTTIERGVQLGRDSWIGPNVSLAYCLIGERCMIHSGARLGQDGYGFAPGVRYHKKVPQLGRVIIGDDVEIGANTCIDRGTSMDTEIGDGTKLDNLVQVAHNVRIGKGCFITSQVGIAGSSEIGNHVMMGGQSGISGHLKVGDGAKVAAQSGITKNIPPGETVVGFPATDSKRFWKNMATLNRMIKLNKK